jgi:predicted  nucleic acid-binding Zn-ribbon protein
VSTLIDESRADLAARLKRSSDELIQLSQLSGKNRELIEQMRATLLKEKDSYDATAEQFRATRATVQAQGAQLMALLSEDALGEICQASRAAMEACLTTRGLTQGIRQLSGRMVERIEVATRLAQGMLETLEQAYSRFHVVHQLPKMQVPRLDLKAYRNRLQALTQETEAFCRDPANLMLEKRFMIRRFYAGLAEEAKQAFNLARIEAERWQRIALDPVMTRIREHKLYLDNRLAGLQRILENMGTLQGRMQQIKQEIERLRAGRTELTRIAAELAG